MEQSNNMIYLETEGSSYERGKIHGESFKKHINTMIRGFKAVTRHFGYTSFDLYMKDILENLNNSK